MKLFKKWKNEKINSDTQIENDKIEYSLKKKDYFDLKCFQKGLNEAIAMLEIEFFTNDNKFIKKEETYKNFDIQYRFRGLKYFLKIIRKNKKNEILDNLTFQGQNGWSLDIHYGQGIEKGNELEIENFIDTDLERLLDLTSIMKEYVDFWYNNIEQNEDEINKKYDKTSLIRQIAEYNNYWGTHINLASKLEIIPFEVESKRKH